MRRRTVLGAAAATAAATGLWVGRPRRPPAGVERRFSTARGREVDFYTAVPDGHGDGRGLPVCLILHGGTARPADFAALGFQTLLTDAVRRGAAPFVLAGATGDRLAWQRSGDDDPQRMVRDELPDWCAARGFDAARPAAWGWSMGGYGALLLAESFPGFVRAVAAFSPAVAPSDPVFTGASRLAGTPVGLWCGLDDGLYPNTLALARALPEPPAAGGYAPGRHHFAYWRTVIPSAFDFIAAALRG
ncbi:alpha/beta hydrolase [Catenuloplanes sp. NPDC051500]|uniref:alpha/beta hydrolase n=1 Tax=Catenuloplanes sp. NPDC051500 TaxID=3363959 RepID=UPI0037A6A29B